MAAGGYANRKDEDATLYRHNACRENGGRKRAGLTTRATVVRASIVHAERDRLAAVLFLDQRCERASPTSPGPADFRASEQRSVWR